MAEEWHCNACKEPVGEDDETCEHCGNDPTEEPEEYEIPRGMKECDTCGRIIAKNAKTCPACGGKQVDTSGSVVGLGCAVVVLIAVGIGLWGTVKSCWTETETTVQTSQQTAQEEVITAQPEDVQRAVETWLRSWENQAWANMAEMSQARWRNQQTDPAGLLEAQYGIKEIKDYTITDIDIRTNYMAKATIELDYEAMGSTKQVVIVVNVIRENEDGQPDKGGYWGVNPISAMAETER